MSTKKIIVGIAFIFVLFLFYGCVSLKNEPVQPVQMITYSGNQPLLTPIRKKELMDAAFQCPRELKESFVSVADYLAEKCVNDWEKTWILYCWIADNIAYDTDSFFSGTYTSQSSESVLSSGVAVCAGYSSVFSTLGEIMGITVEIVNGNGKGYGYIPGEPADQNHAWNAVHINDTWHLFDTTWGAGYVNNRTFEKQFDGSWFDVPPEEMIFTHFPEEERWQLLDVTISRDEYRALPQIKPTFFQMGFTVDQVKETLKKENYSGIVMSYDHAPGVAIIKAPVSRTLNRGETYIFNYRIPDNENTALIVNGEFHFFLAPGQMRGNMVGEYDGTILEDGSYYIEIRPDKPGDVKLTAGTDTYWSILEYEVE